MFELRRTIPDYRVLLALEPEELGAKLLFLLHERRQNEQSFFLSNLLNELWHRTGLPDEQPPYPQAQKNEIELALSEAWSWLVAQGLLVSAPGQVGGDDGKALSRRAKNSRTRQNLHNTLLLVCSQRILSTHVYLKESGWNLCAASLMLPYS
jgi:hypothetical protein